MFFIETAPWRHSQTKAPPRTPGNTFYTKALVGVNDKIIPAKNQLNFWEKFDVPVVKLDCGHFPFYNYKSWEEIMLCK